LATKSNTKIKSVSSNGKLPEGWRMVKFGDVVNDVKESEKNPLDSGLERYIGLEHIEAENLHLKEWGDLTTDEVSFTKRFRKGQVLFGKRRAYQRKVALAEFDGICSSDILTFEPKDEELLPELLPFIVQSDAFFNHALGTSSGSLSPRTRWSQLRDFEFPLPSIGVQRQLSGILEATTLSWRLAESVLQNLVTLKSSLQAEVFSGKLSHGMSGVNTELGVLPSTWRVAALGSVTTRICVGLAMSVTKHYRQTGVPMLRNQNIRPMKLDDGEILFLDPSFADSVPNKRLVAGDVITTRTGANMGQTCLVPKKYEGAHTFTTLITSCDPTVLLPEFLVHYMNSAVGFREMERLSTSGGKNNLNVTSFQDYRVPIPPVSDQRNVIRVLESTEAAIAKANSKVQDARRLHFALVESLLTSCR